jgi:histone H4
MSSHQLKPQIAKRHAKSKRGITKITKAALRRLAQRGGNTRISGLVFGEARKVVDYYLEMIVKDAILMADYSRRKTIYKKDIEFALARNNRKLYGIN